MPGVADLHGCPGWLLSMAAMISPSASSASCEGCQPSIGARAAEGKRGWGKPLKCPQKSMGKTFEHVFKKGWDPTLCSRRNALLLQTYFTV